MRRRRTITRKPAKTQHGSATKPKRSNAPTAARQASSRLADLQQQVSALARELTEAREQQTANFEVLKIISSSPGELEPVFNAMLERAVRICEAKSGMMQRYRDGTFQTVAMVGVPSVLAQALVDRGTHVPPNGSPLDLLLRTKRTVHILDQMQEKVQPPSARLFGARSHLTVPMLKEDEFIGAFTIYRTEVRPFTEKQIELVTNFAAQAIIATENTRLLGELRARTDELARSVEELRALGEVSRTLNSTLDLETVQSAIVTKATQLSGTEAGTIYVLSEANRGFELRATYGMTASLIDAIKDQHAEISKAVALAIEQRQPMQTPDLNEDPPSVARDIILRAGYRARLVMPLVAADRIVGALVVRRQTPGEFPKNTIELLQTFAAPIGARDPERKVVPRDRGEGPRTRTSEPTQVAVPRQYEPRVAHTVKLDYRPHRYAGKQFSAFWNRQGA
jgi:GAF domain-containing protein